MSFDITQHQGAGKGQLDLGQAQPFIRILQQASPEVDESSEKYVEGAKVGDLFWNKTRQILPQPLKVIPITSASLKVEWRPRSEGGGVIGYHNMAIDQDPQYSKDGYKEFLGTNPLVHTTYWYVLAFIDGQWQNSLFGMASSQLPVSRKWAKAIAGFKYDENPEIEPPMFARSWEVTTVREENAQGQPYRNYAIGSPEVLDFDEDEETLSLAAERYEPAEREHRLLLEQSDPSTPELTDSDGVF